MREKIYLIGSWLVILLAIALQTSTSLATILQFATLLTWGIHIFLAQNLYLRHKLGQNKQINLKQNLIENLKLTFWHKPFVPFYIFVALFGIGALYSTAPTTDILISLKKMSKFLYIPIIAYFLHEQKTKKRFLFAFLITATVTVILGVIKGYTPNKSTIHLLFPTSGVFKDKIFTSLLIAFSIYILFHQINLKKTISWLYFLIIGLATFYLLFINKGRTGQLIFFVLFILFFIQKFKLKGIIISSVAVAVTITSAFIFSSTFNQCWKNVYQHSKEYMATIATAHPTNTYNNNVNKRVIQNQVTSTGLRLEFITNSFQLIKKKPIFGWGTGSFKTIYAKHTPKTLTNKTQNPHCEYINVMFQLGLIGLIALLWVFLSQLHFSFSLSSSNKYILQGIIITIMVGSTMNSWLMDFVSGNLLVLFVAFSGSFGVGFKTMQLKKH